LKGVTIKVMAPFAGWLRPAAQRLARRTMQAGHVGELGDDAGGTTSLQQVVDGYLVKAVRNGRRCVASIVDLGTAFLFVRVLATGSFNVYVGRAAGPRHLYRHGYVYAGAASGEGPQHIPGGSGASDRRIGIRSELCMSENFVAEGGRDNVLFSWTSSGLYFAQRPSGVDEHAGGIGFGCLSMAPAGDVPSGYGTKYPDGSESIVAISSPANGGSTWVLRIMEAFFRARHGCHFGHHLPLQVFDNETGWGGNEPTETRPNAVVPQLCRVTAARFPTGADAAPLPEPDTSPGSYEGAERDCGYMPVVTTTATAAHPRQVSATYLRDDCGLNGIAFLRARITERLDPAAITWNEGLRMKSRVDWSELFQLSSAGEPRLRVETWLDRWYEVARANEQPGQPMHPTELGGWCQNSIDSMRVSFDPETGELVVFFVALLGRQFVDTENRPHMCHAYTLAAIRVDKANGANPIVHPPQVLFHDVVCAGNSPVRPAESDPAIAYIPVIRGAERLRDGHRAVVMFHRMDRAGCDYFIRSRRDNLSLASPLGYNLQYAHAAVPTELRIYSEDGLLASATCEQLGASTQPWYLGPLPGDSRLTPSRRPMQYFEYASLNYATKVAPQKLAVSAAAYPPDRQNNGFILYDEETGSLEYRRAMVPAWGWTHKLPSITCPQQGIATEQGETDFVLVLSYEGPGQLMDSAETTLGNNDYIVNPDIGTYMSTDSGQTWFKLADFGTRNGAFFTGPRGSRGTYTKFYGVTGRG